MICCLHRHVRPLFFVFLALVGAQGCTVKQALPERFTYDCNFNYFDYDQAAPHIETQRLSDVFVWIQRRMKGELQHSPGKALARDIERKHFATRSYEDPAIIDRNIWVVSAAVTKNNNPMNVIIDKRGPNYFITRVNDQHVSMLGLTQGFLWASGGACNTVEYPWLLGETVSSQ